VEKPRQNRRGDYEKRDALPAPGCKIMLYKVSSGYTAKFLAKEKSFTTPPGFFFFFFILV
jgi:hypothetical protein